MKRYQENLEKLGCEILSHLVYSLDFLSGALKQISDKQKVWANVVVYVRIILKSL